MEIVRNSLPRLFQKSIFERLFRRSFPSISSLTYAPVFRAVINPLAALGGICFPEFRRLPPAHLRARVGVGNRIFFNQAYFVTCAFWFWLDNFSRGLCNLNSHVVEIGCGCGKTFQHLHDTREFSGTFVGIDIDSEMLSFCRRRYTRSNFKFTQSPHQNAAYSREQGAEHSQKSAPWSIPVESNSQDFIYSCSLFSHLFEAEIINYLTESCRILKVGGAIRMSYFGLESVQKGGRWTFSHRMGSAYVESLKVPEAAIAYPQKTMERFFIESGFSLIEFRAGEAQSEVIARKEKNWLPISVN